MKSIIAKVILAVLGLGILFGVFNTSSDSGSEASNTLGDLRVDVNKNHFDFKNNYVPFGEEEVNKLKYSFTNDINDFYEYGYKVDCVL